MSRDFIGSAAGRSFLKSPNRDRVTRGGWTDLYCDITQVQIVTGTNYARFLGAQITDKINEALAVLRETPYPTSGNRVITISPQTWTYGNPVDFPAGSTLIAEANGTNQLTFSVGALLQANRSQNRTGLPGDGYLSSFSLLKSKVVFSRPALSPFCIYQNKQYLPAAGTSNVASFEVACFKSRRTLAMGEETDAANMYRFSPDDLSVEFGPTPDLPSGIALEQLVTGTINGAPTPLGGFGVYQAFRRIAGIYTDATGTKQTLKTAQRVPIGDLITEIAPCCDLSLAG